MPLYWEGWIKYLHYNESEKKQGRAFWKNSEFDNQQNRGIQGDINAKDDKGFINIPNELYFYALLSKDSLSILSSRAEGFSNTVDALDLTYIKPIPEDNHFAGGLQDFGKFDEGFCFKANVKMSTEPFIMTQETPSPVKGKEQKWVFCTDDEAQKTQLLNLMIQLKLKQQHERGVYLETKYEIERKQGLANAENNQPLEDIDKKKKIGPNDGYWQIIQDWTQCTLKCGGGTQFKQKICIPPKYDGKPCEGPAIESRPCNDQPCPTTITLQKINKPVTNGESVNGNSTLPVITKMMPVSNRPQRYDKCFIKEADALLELDDKSTKEFITKPKVPCRLVLNDKTVTAYQNDELTSRYQSFILKDTTFIRLSNEKRCFKLRNNVKEMMICQLDTGNAGDFVEEWDYDFNLFKNQCSKKREKSDNFLPEEEKLEKEFNKKVSALKVEMVAEKVDDLKHKTEENEEIQLGKKVDDAQTTSLMAIQKESKLEDLLEKEEAAKEEEEDMLMDAQVAEEKKKEECLLKSLKEKEIEDQMNLAKAKAEENMSKIKEDTQKQITLKRLGIKKKILEMKKIQERKRLAKRSQIQAIRTSIAEKINTVSRVGDDTLCVGQINETDRESYCTKNFLTDFTKFADCKEEDQFCYVCCENEFGDLHVMERDKCYGKCDQYKEQSSKTKSTNTPV